MLAVRRQRKPCRRRFVDVSAARRGRQTTKHAVQIEPVHSGVVSGTTVRALVLGRTTPPPVQRQLMSVSPRCRRRACVQEATYGPLGTTCTGCSLRLVASAALRQDGRGHAIARLQIHNSTYSGSAYCKRVPRTNCALRIKKCAPRLSSGIYF